MAFISDLRMVANAWLRPADTGTSNNVYNFFEETMKVIGEDKIGLVRADSGFFGNKFFTFLESRSKKYIVAVKSNALLKQQILNIRNWLAVDEGIQISEFNYKAHSWNKERRVIVIRQSIVKKPKALGKILFKEFPEHCFFRYQQYVTNLDLPAAEVWRMYCGRADSENRIKELKYEFGMTGFCLNKFYAREDAFRMVVVAYNFLSLFRQVILKQVIQPTLSTIRFECFALGSWIVKRGRKKILKLSVNTKRRAWLDALFSKLVDLGPPFLVKT